jgi:hypothetical protein
LTRISAVTLAYGEFAFAFLPFMHLPNRWLNVTAV